MSLSPESKSNSNWLPDTSHGFWRLCLLTSLLLNLVVAGVVIGGAWHHRGNPGQPGFQQFVPGRFFVGLDGARRKELGDMLRNAKQDFEATRQKNGELAVQVAAELEKSDYDPAKVAALIDGFTTGPDSMATKGASVLKDFYAKLTPEERMSLAKAIRERQARKG